MTARRFISAFLTALIALPMLGQEVLPDGIIGRDGMERLQYIHAFSPQSDTLLIETDTLGRFEISSEMMELLPGNIYLKPLVQKPKAKLVLENPVDSIHVYRQGRERFLARNHYVGAEPVFYYDPETILLKESVVRARKGLRFQDKVTVALDSLFILDNPEWVCVHGDTKFINDYLGYSHHPGGTPFYQYDGERLVPKRGEAYSICLIWYDSDNDKWWDLVCKYAPVVYPGPQYTEEELLELYGMSKVQGYHPKREFYEPDSVDLSDPTLDYRNLLQWRPAVLTDENGFAEISFAASDVNTEFIGIVEAVDGTGLLGAQSFTFRVIKQ